MLLKISYHEKNLVLNFWSDVKLIRMENCMAGKIGDVKLIRMENGMDG